MHRSKIELHNVDCLPFMKQFEDNQFDLAIVDPPYGIGVDGQKESKRKNPKHNRKAHDFKGWDNEIPGSFRFQLQSPGFGGFACAVNDSKITAG